MMRNSSARNIVYGGVVGLCMAASPSALMASDLTVQGVFALPDAEQEVTGTMVVRETGPLTREIELVYNDKATGKQVPEFEVELTQQLHILATDADLSTLVHRHVKAAGADGKFSTEFDFPKEGLYHIYTDAVPSGFGQQVLRFDVPIGDDITSSASSSPVDLGSVEVSDGVLESANGDYTVRLDVSQLQPGQESMVSLSVEKGGEPANDLTPYLGVAAHAVFIRAEDLAYVHAHATSGEESTSHQEHGAQDHGSHDMHVTPAESAADGHAQPAHHGHEMAGGAEHGSAHHDSGQSQPMVHSGAHGDMADTEPVSADMILHVTPPGPGRYALWIEFMGGGEVTTVPFNVEVAETKH